MSWLGSAKYVFDAKKKVWASEKTSNSGGIFNSEIGLGRLIMEVFKTTPERISQVFFDNGAEMTCQEMRVRTMKIATHLMKRGYKQNDVAGIVAVNSENVAPVVFACLILGMPLNILAPSLSESDIVHMYSKTRPKVIFCDSNAHETLHNAVKAMELDCEIFTLREKVAQFEFVDELISKVNVKNEEFIYPELINIADSIAFIMCSSGSTGPPKAICKSHSELIHNHTNRYSSSTDLQDVLFNFSSLYWITGVYFLIMGALYGMKRVITTKNFTPQVLSEIVEQYKISILFLPPSMLDASLGDASAIKSGRHLESVRVFITGGAHVSNSLKKAAQEQFPDAKLVVVYGNLKTKKKLSPFYAI